MKVSFVAHNKLLQLDALLACKPEPPKLTMCSRVRGSQMLEAPTSGSANVADMYKFVTHV